MQCPAPGANHRGFMRLDRIVDTDSLIIDYNKNSQYLSIWCLNKPRLMKIKKRANEAKAQASALQEDMIEKIIEL